MKKVILTFLVLVLAVFSAACSNSSSASDDTVKVKVGVSGTDTRVWDFIAKKAEKEGIEIEVITFSDYVAPNTALAEGEVDINAFQTVAYFDTFIEEHNVDLVPIATTVLAPMGLYSEKYKDVKEIPDGSKIAIPNDPSNSGRALLLLQEAGLITLPEDYDGIAGPEAIVENPKNLKIEQMVPAQTPRALPDVAASIINNGIAVDAGFSPTKDSIFHESATALPYLNIIATRAEDKDNKTYKKVAELYQSDDTAEFIEKEYKGNMIPTFVPLSEIGW
ncbi:methionine ABC transporter substrate-binding protein [Bacillus sp. FJAT-18017]|uniref:MetQ/NlpA family ABC transporter substrate-binding protein n=1 Tax=Bacillus sp. FJAT-18017 TaxID=1705566 RepID=UPI0006AEAEB8|nr:MetQ/NlpA family ABC transporter substrate-binding protein [Bacillus sp. FJAT-18017]ALC89414.1 methionine ABC transporter substrate-binding protein [Bacillus sp. FJAT-18017]